ncbi:MAG: acyltransferase family protein, partial [Oscillospiraceae bacterium]|nr:acyltransferase family protein [Oscillospiraceae bacterium]
MEGQRIQRWDNVKGLLITLVVTGHFLMYVKNNGGAQIILLFIYSFHMPAFVLISGMMSKRAVKQKDLSKITYFLIIFLLIKALLALAKLIAGYENIGWPIYIIDDVSWYAFALAVFYPLTMILSKLNKKVVLTVSVVAACAAGYADSISTMLSASRLFVFFPFFFMGYCLDRDRVLAAAKERNLRTAALLVLACCAVLTVLFADKMWPLFGLLQGKYPYTDLLNPEMICWGGLFRLGWYVLAFLLTASIVICCPDKKPVLDVGKNTLSIYVYHNPLIILCMRTPIGGVLYQSIFFMLAAGIILALVIGVVVVPSVGILIP